MTSSKSANHMQANVVVIGSLNMDLVTRAPRMPAPGETLVGNSFVTVPGGKGANQAVAAARLGAVVAMIGCVGDDAYGEQLRKALLDEQIDCQGVTAVAGVSTGIASIMVDANGQNAIVIVAGGNGHLTPEVVKRFDAYVVGGATAEALDADIVEVFEVTDWDTWVRIRDDDPSLRPVMSGFDDLVEPGSVRSSFVTPITKAQ